MNASIIIPARNEERFVGALLKSVRQFGPSGAEVIVVDNGSTDATAETAASLGARVIRTGHSFPGVARNAGAWEAAGDILVFLDADVELTKDWQDAWSRCKALLTADPKLVCGSICDVSRSPSWIERVWFKQMRSRERSHVDGANMIITRSFFNQLKGFECRLETGEDVDLCNRATAAGGSVRVLPELRVHHEGFPRTMRAFLRRERWHGRGDLVSLNAALTSRVLLISLAFVALNLLTIGFIARALYDHQWLPAAITAMAVIGLCIFGAKRALGTHLGRAAIAAPIMYLYYIGRALSAVDALTLANRSRHR